MRTTQLPPSPLPAACARVSAAAERALARPQEFKTYQAELNQHLRTQVDPEFYSHWDVTPTPFHFTDADVDYLDACGHRLFNVVEKVVQMYLNGDPELDRLFRRYSLFRPYMTKRFLSWQEYGRYDFIIDRRGEPVFIELNTAMASGYLPMGHVNRCFWETAPDFLRPAGERAPLPYDDFADLGAELARMEIVAASDPKGAVAILVDENAKYHEADMIKHSLESVGRKVVIGDVRSLVRKGGDIYLGDQRISTTYNKFRLFGAQHHWGSGAWVDNRVFLEGILKNRILSINNFAAMTISEDKSIFAAMRLPGVEAALTPVERLLVARHTPDTHQVEPGPARIEGREVNLLEHLREHRGDYVLKPRSDYRGSGAYSGRDHAQDEWNSILEKILGQDYLAQTRVDANMFDVTHTAEDGSVKKAPMRLAGGLYFANMHFRGGVARAAPWEIVNAINHAHVLPIIVTDK